MLALSAAVLAWIAYRSASRAAFRNTGDFFHFYYAALAAANDADIYASGTGGYIYPPLLAVVASPLAAISEIHAAWVWLAINLALTIASLWIAISYVLPRFAGTRVPYPAAGVALLSIALSFEQIRWELELGQTDSILLFAFVFSMVFSRSRPIPAAIVLGFAANVKYLTLIAVPYLLIRRRYKAALALVISTTLWALAPALIIGWSRNLDYLARALKGVAATAGLTTRDASAAAPNSILWHRSVSITSAAARLADSLGIGIAAGLAIAGVIALGTLLLAWRIYSRCGWSLLRGRRTAPAPLHAVAADADRLACFEWAGLIVAVLAFGPQTTTRHLYLMLLPNVLAAILLITPRPGVDRRWILAGVVALQLGTRLPPGSAGVDRAVEAWRAVGGASWCVLAMYLTLLRSGLCTRHLR